MKRKILNFSFAVFAIGLLFTSCLGDNDTTYKAGSDFVYVTTYDNQKLAMSSEYVGLSFTGSEVLSATSGRCYFASYNLNSSDMTGNVFNAQNLYMGSPIPQSMGVQFEKPTSTVSDAAIDLGNFVVQRFNSSDVLGDKWLLSINLTKAPADVVTGYVYYDAANQSTDGGANPLPVNRIVLDVLFTNTSPGGVSAKTDYNYVLDLAQIRTSAALLKNKEGKNVAEFNYEVSGKKYAPLQIIFRYNKLNQTGNASVATYYPSATGAASYLMYIAQK